jgi:galactokinase
LAAAEAAGWAPGRVNLIGEHTDYNGGFVLPVALTLGVEAAVDIAPSPAVVGDGADERSALLAAAVCRSLGVPDAVRVATLADLPAGAGLGSSAAFELALARALRELHGLVLEDRDLALACLRAENELVPCGPMDQLASALGTPASALLIDCTSFDLRRIALPEGVELAVLDSGVRHANAASGYAERRAECEQAARALGVTVLREVDDVAQLAELPEPLRRRARHVVEENARVLAAADALEAGDVAALAALMRAAHASLSGLFEVSTAAIDELVERAEAAGAYAARLTGGGFGGAVVGLCEAGTGRRVATRAGAPLLALVSAA